MTKEVEGCVRRESVVVVVLVLVAAMVGVEVVEVEMKEEMVLVEDECLERKRGAAATWCCSIVTRKMVRRSEIIFLCC